MSKLESIGGGLYGIYSVDAQGHESTTFLIDHNGPKILTGALSTPSGTVVLTPDELQQIVDRVWAEAWRVGSPS